jgi:hypothetical protein
MTIASVVSEAKITKVCALRYLVSFLCQLFLILIIFRRYLMNIVDLNLNEVISVSGGIDKVNAALALAGIGFLVGAAFAPPILGAYALTYAGHTYAVPAIALANAALITGILGMPAIAGFAIGSIIGK